MHCHKVLSILISILLFFSLAACLIGLWSRNWWHGQFEAVIPVFNQTNVTHGYEMHWLFGVNFGLWKFCWRALQPRRTTDINGYEIVPPLHHCISKMPTTPSMEDVSEEDMIHFRNILICMVVAVIFNILAFAFAFFKLPCIKRLKKALIFLTIIMTIIAAIAVLVALFIANEMLYYGAPFMDRLLSTTPNFGEPLSNLANKLLEAVFAKVEGSGLSAEFSKGYSFTVTCIAEVFLLLVVILTIIENCCFNKVRDTEYLIDDAGEKPSH